MRSEDDLLEAGIEGVGLNPVACDFSQQRVGVLKKALDGFLGNIHKVRWAQDVPPPTDPWKWGGAIGAWILSPAQVDALNPKA